MKRLRPFIPDVIWETLIHIRECNLLLVASSLAYTTILSIIPALAISFAIFQAYGGMQKLYDIVEPFILNNLVEGAGDQAVSILSQLAQNAHALGIGGLIGLMLISMSMLNSIEKAINHVWHAPQQRSFLWRFSSYLLLISIGPLALSLVLGLAASTNLPLAKILSNNAGLFFLGVLGFFCVYKFIPNCRVRSLYALFAAFLTSTSWLCARWAYHLYTERVVTYHRIYGSLGAVPILLIWIYIVWVIILAGAALSAVLQKRLEATPK